MQAGPYLRTPVPLRGLDRASAWELADAGGALWKAAPFELSAAAALWVAGPVVVGWLLAPLSKLAGAAVALAGAAPGYAVVTALALGVGFGRPITHRQALRTVARRWWPLLASLAWIVAMIAVTLGFGLLRMGRYAPLAAVVVAEPGGARGCRRRSIDLTSDRRRRSLAAMALSCGPGVALAVAATHGAFVAVRFVDLPSGSTFASPALALGTTLVGVLVLPWLACTGVAGYLAARQRWDGLDLQLELQALALERS